MQQSTACLHFRGVQRRCVWAVGGLGVAACLACVAAAAVAVDRQAPQSYGGVNWPPDKCVLRLTLSVTGGRTAPPDTLRRRPDTERTCLAVGPTQFTPPNQTRQNSPVCVVSGMAVWIGQSLHNVFRLQIFWRQQSRVVGNPLHTAEADATQTRQFWYAQK